MDLNFHIWKQHMVHNIIWNWILHFHTFALIFLHIQITVHHDCATHQIFTSDLLLSVMNWTNSMLPFFTWHFFLWKQHVALELKFEHVKRKIFQLWNEVTDFHSVKISTCETPIFLCRSQTFMCDLLFYMRITNSTCGNERFLIWVFNLRSQEIVSMTETQVPRCSNLVS